MLNMHTMDSQSMQIGFHNMQTPLFRSRTSRTRWLVGLRGADDDHSLPGRVSFRAELDDIAGRIPGVRACCEALDIEFVQLAPQDE